MSTPKPGQIRCPTCHRSTAPAAFCTHCGSAIPSSAVTRPRGMDRDELDARIRGRRVDPTYRRGGFADEWGEDAGGYAPFQPEPEDALARRADPERRAPRHVDNVRDQPAPVAWPRHDIDEPAGYEPGPDEPSDPWRRGREVPDAAEPPVGSLVPPLPPRDVTPAPVTGSQPPAPSQPDPWAARSVEAPPPIEEIDYAAGDEADEGWPSDEPYYIPADDDGERRRSSALPIIGFVALGVIALLVGVFFSNMFSTEDPVGRASATPSATATPEPTAPAETPAPTGSAGASASGQPNASEGPPIVFPDGFVATTEPCVSEPNESGCNSDGATNSGSIWVYIGFEKGQRDDVLGMTILDAAGGVAAQASIELADLECPAGVACNGWILFPGFGTPFTGLESGEYTIRINRNGLPAAEADFNVT